MNTSGIRHYSAIQSITSLIHVTHLQDIADFCIYNFEEESGLDHSVLSHYRQNYYELVVDITDNCTFVVEQERIVAQKNRITLIKPFQLQGPGSHETSTNTTAKGYILYFTPAFLANTTGLGQWNIFNPQRISSFTLTDAEMNGIAGILRELYAEYRNYQGHTSTLIMRHYLQILLLKMEQKQQSMDAGKNVLTNRLYAAFVEAVNQHFLQLTTVKEYAHLLNVSPKHLSDTIKSAGHVNALNLINEARINHSKTLLFQTDKTIQQIASELRFADANNFSTYFRKHTHESPIQYRKNHR